MGLDMYLYAAKRNDKSRQNREEIGYWRKYGELDNYMGRYWLRHANGLEMQDFNCAPVRVRDDCLSDIIWRLRRKGKSDDDLSMDNCEAKETIKIMQEGLKRIEAGEFIIYNSDW